VDFTREPIIETVITPREGYRLVVRNSKVMGQEEHFVDSIEVVSFGGAFFFRSIERPKPFLVPIGDYEVMEVRESRIVLKSPHAQEGSIKIGAPREGQRENQREFQRPPRVQEVVEESKQANEVRPQASQGTQQQGSQDNTGRVEGRQQEKRRERRKPFRRRRGQYREEGREGAPGSAFEEGSQQEVSMSGIEETILAEEVVVGARASHLSSEAVAPTLRSVLPPPTTLIRDDLQRLRDNEMYRGAFFLRDEKDEDDDDSSLESFAAEVTASESSAGHDSTTEGITKESSPEESFLFQQAVEEDIDRDVEDPLSR